MSPHLMLTRPHQHYSTQFRATQYNEDIDHLNSLQCIMGREHLLCEKKLRKLGLFNLRRGGFGVT